MNPGIQTQFFRRPDAVKPGIQCVRTHWIRGFMPFHRIRHIGTVMLMVPA